MIGKTISHYNIIEQLGAGGMGVVYKAEDTKLKRTVAIKFLPPELTRNDEAKNRFIHEAQAASALEHHNICNIHEIDQTEDDQLFVVMACYEGETLKEKIERAPLKIDEAVDIAIQISHGLTKAHEKGIIHRDIKPSNIFITTDGIVKIIDFGLAKLTGKTVLTKEGTTFGTVNYMSPEQTRGEEIDNRTDIWSLGIVLYEMIIGQAPFKGEYEQAVMYSIVNEEPEPITGLRTGVPMNLEHVVDKALSKNPNERYQHADELSADLKKLHRELEISKKAPSTSVEIQQTSKSRLKRVIMYTGIPIILFALIMTIYFLSDRIFEPKEHEADTISQREWENSIAVLPFADLSPGKDQEYFCDGMTEQIITNLSKIKRLKVIARTSVMTYKNTSKQIPEIGRELKVNNILEGSIRKYGNSIRVTAQLINTKDGSHLWADDFDRELEHIFEVQDDVSQAIASNLLSTLSIQEIAEMNTDRPNNIENYDRYMQAKGFHRKFLETQNPDYLHDAILLLKQILKLEPDYLSANVELADVYNTYFNELAETKQEKSSYLQLQKKHYKIAHNLNPNSFDVQYLKIFISVAEEGLEYFSENRLKKFTDYIKIDPNRASAYFYIGYWLNGYGLVHQALLYLNKAVELNPLFTWNLSNRGWAYFLIGEFEKAELDYKKALEIEPHDYNNLGRYLNYLLAFGRIDEAEKLIFHWQDKNPKDNKLKQLRAFLYAVRDDKENALTAFNKTAFKKKYDEFFNLAILYLLVNDQEKAIELIIEGEKDYTNNNISQSKYFEYLNLPYYKILHNDPRFQEILAKHKKIYQENLQKYGDIDL